MKKTVLLLTLISLMAGLASAKEPSTDYRNALILAYSPVNSVYEDDNIKLEIYDEQLWATNKTKKTIFIDLSQSFLFNNGSSYPIFSKRTNEKKASQFGATTTDSDPLITIAPNVGAKQNETAICNMSKNILGKYTTTESPSGNFSEYDKRLLNLLDELVSESINADPKGKAYLGTASRHLTEDESISNIGATVAYALKKNPEEWTNAAISTWVSDIIFAPFYVTMPKELSKNEKSGFGIKETDYAVIHIKADSPFEYNQDKSPLIACDWVGNFKKGTFDLNSTRIKKVKKNTGAAVLGAVLTMGMSLAAGVPFTETTYKSKINFDGADADWGKMKYAFSIPQTKHKASDEEGGKKQKNN